jgi:rod shape-determining protein MreC
MEYQPQPFFSRGPTAFARLLMFSLLSVALIVSDSRFHYLAHVQQAFAAVLYPLQRLVLAPVGVLEHAGSYLVTHATLAAENHELRADALERASALQRLAALERENARLRAMLETREQSPVTAVFAEIMYAHRDPFTRRVIIGTGLSSGLRAGQPVVDRDGLVGQVTKTFPWTSEVTLITDKGQTVPVAVARSGVRGVLHGTGSDGVLELRFMPFSADVQAGDQLVTSGIDGTYPPGVPVARIDRAERDPAFPFMRITATPVAGVNRHREVLVLDYRPPVAAPQPEPARPEPKKRPRRGD